MNCWSNLFLCSCSVTPRLWCPLLIYFITFFIIETIFHQMAAKWNQSEGFYSSVCETCSETAAETPSSVFHCRTLSISSQFKCCFTAFSSLLWETLQACDVFGHPHNQIWWALPPSSQISLFFTSQLFFWKRGSSVIDDWLPAKVAGTADLAGFEGLYLQF